MSSVQCANARQTRLVTYAYLGTQWRSWRSCWAEDRVEVAGVVVRVEAAARVGVPARCCRHRALLAQRCRRRRYQSA
jgi:hypothetical protein